MAVNAKVDDKKWRECKSCGDTGAIIEISIGSDNSNASTTIHICDKCVRKLMFELDLVVGCQYEENVTIN